MSNITINISLQPDEENGVSIRKEIGSGGQAGTYSSAPMPPESDEAATSASDYTSDAAGSGPAPPKEAYKDQELVTKQAASPPRFSDEDVTSVASDISGAPPTPPRDLPGDISAEKGGDTGRGASPSPPSSDDGNNKKGKSGSGKKK